VKLIVTEKDSAARKIAEILGGRPTVKEHGRGRQKVKSYHFTYDGSDAVAIGLRGHVMETVFPNTYKRWSLKYLGDMIEKPGLAWVVDGGAAGTLAALRAAAKGATELVIATDYDREGELIGHEALEILRGDALKHNPGDKPEKKKRKAAAKDGEARAKAPAPAPSNGDPHVKPMLPAAVVDRHVRVRYSALTP
jgi:DNA topoisomerase IA